MDCAMHPEGRKIACCLPTTVSLSSSSNLPSEPCGTGSSTIVSIDVLLSDAQSVTVHCKRQECFLRSGGLPGECKFHDGGGRS
jgi:hypothetical protein